MALAACLLYCAASSATLASAGAGLTDLGALWAPCDGTLGQCAVGATRVLTCEIDLTINTLDFWIKIVTWPILSFVRSKDRTHGLLADFKKRVLLPTTSNGSNSNGT